MLINIVLFQEGTNCSNTRSAIIKICLLPYLLSQKITVSERCQHSTGSSVKHLLHCTFSSVKGLKISSAPFSKHPLITNNENETVMRSVWLNSLTTHKPRMQMDPDTVTLAIHPRVSDSTSHTHKHMHIHRNYTQTCSSSQHTHKHTVCVYEVCDPLTPWTFIWRFRSLTNIWLSKRQKTPDKRDRKYISRTFNISLLS